MTTINGYGEDALTMWALSQRIGRILEQLHDDTAPSEAVVFYRPSGGRGERWWKKRGARSLIGEFDAIIGTAAGVYLVEAKWVRPGQSDPSAEQVQLDRHTRFRTYLELWRQTTPGSWGAFLATAGAEFQQRHPEWELAYGEVSAASMEFLLRRLDPCGDVVTDVLLIIEAELGCATGTPPRPRRARWSRGGAPPLEWSGFVRVCIPFTPVVGGTHFFDTQIVLPP